MLPQLYAERQLDAIQAAIAPHMKADGFRDLHRGLRGLLGRDAEPAETADAEKLAALGISVVVVEGGDSNDG